MEKSRDSWSQMLSRDCSTPSNLTTYRLWKESTPVPDQSSWSKESTLTMAIKTMWFTTDKGSELEPTRFWLTSLSTYTVSRPPLTGIPKFQGSRKLFWCWKTISALSGLLNIRTPIWDWRSKVNPWESTTVFYSSTKWLIIGLRLLTRLTIIHMERSSKCLPITS